MFMETRTLTRKIILDAVLTWPEPERLGLVQDIMQGMSTDHDDLLPPRKNTADQALGLLRHYTHEPPPTDEEVEQWLEERRMQKYG
jgi:hypothetical protein